MSAAAPAGPVADNARADVLDALRGFALLGIFISHVPDFSGYNFMPAAQRAALGWPGVDGAAALVQDFLIRGKFYALFSLLFGIGFAVQLDSAARRGASFVRHFVRRLAVLLLIGLVHASLWYGDILKDYAVLGLVLILLRGASIRALAWATAVALLLRLVWPVIVWLAVTLLAPATSGAESAGGFDALTHVFASGTLSADFLANLALVRLKLLQTVYEGKAISILGMFLLGALVGRLQLYRDVARHRALLRGLFLVCAPVGVLGNAVLTPIHAATAAFPPTGMWVVENMIFAIAVPAMAVGYASGFALLWTGRAGAALRLLAPVGRMALTTYLTQTIIGIALFYGVGLGLGLGGAVGLVAGAALALIIFAGQCALAALWLRWFRFGPVEWVWRRATYGVPVAFRRA